MKVFGVAFCVRSSGELGFAISASYCSSDGNDGFIARPRTSEYSWPVVDHHHFQRYGASQTQGIFGGVEDPWQKARSEVAERAIGDVITRVMCEILDSREDKEPSLIYILGPALHKIIGRIASLRPPEEVSINWICPAPLPRWIVEGANEPVLLPASDVQTISTWEEEPLVVTGRVSYEKGHVCTIQTLSLWPWETICSTPRPASVTATVWGIALPRELVVASGQIDNYVRQSYPDAWTETGPNLFTNLEALDGEWKESAHLYTVRSEPFADNDEIRVGWRITWM